ncbi:MAG: protein translocase subunit SecF, partial [Gaiellaceae bacterium]
TRITAPLERAATVDQVRNAVGPLGLAEAKIQTLKNPELGQHVVQISTKELPKGGSNAVVEKLNSTFGSADRANIEEIGPSFGQTVAKSAIYAIIASLLIISIYIALRFEWKFAVPVLIALMHDILITAGVYALVGREVTTSTVAALLTIVGFSLYDTIIVFDRIRENVPRMPSAAFSQIVNRSMSEVIVRSMATSFCTILPVLALFLFGGATLKDDYGLATADFVADSVGPTFGQQIARTAVIAVVASLLLIAIYIGFRFSWKFAVPVLIALAHDLLITAGVYALFDREVTTATVAALLTIMGYSLYDTIIVFDRIRENVPRMPRAAFTQIVNRSMAEVLTRSLATSLCTLLPVTALMLFGGETLQDFAFALLVGIASGAYSSIFIASPVLAEWKEREPVYRRRRKMVMEEHGGVVPAFATGAIADDVPAAGTPAPTRRRRPTRRQRVSRTGGQSATATAAPPKPPEVAEPEPPEAPPAPEPPVADGNDGADGAGDRPPPGPPKPKPKRQRPRKKHGRR